MKIVFSILELPIHMWLGILLFILLIFQILIGKRIIKIPFVWHKRNAMALITIATLHALIGMGLWFGFLQYV